MHWTLNMYIYIHTYPGSKMLKKIDAKAKQVFSLLAWCRFLILNILETTDLKKYFLI